MDRGAWQAIKSGFYTTTTNDQLSGWPEKLQSTSQSQTCAKKAHGHCLVASSPCDPLQLSEFQWNHHIWEACSADWGNALETAMPAARVGQQNGPSSSPQQRLIPCCTTKASKVDQTGLSSFASATMFTWPLTNRLPPLQASLQLFAGKTFTNQKVVGNAFQEFVESQSIDFYATGINLLLIGKVCWL